MMGLSGFRDGYGFNPTDMRENEDDFDEGQTDPPLEESYISFSKPLRGVPNTKSHSTVSVS